MADQSETGTVSEAEIEETQTAEEVGFSDFEGQAQRARDLREIRTAGRRTLAVLDLETDPFQHGRQIEPFAAGLYDGTKTVIMWDSAEGGCIERMFVHLQSIEEPMLIYAHNGGKFDWLYFMRYMRGACKIINGRLVEARLGKHLVRDSYSILPFALREFDKGQIDYKKLERGRREQHREEINEYLSRDLTSLYELVAAFREEFGSKLTIGSTSLGKLKEIHPFTRLRASEDVYFRKLYYFGGRVEVFQNGIHEDAVKIFDVNSQYPSVMRNVQHPVGHPWIGRRVNRFTCFVTCEGFSHGAFPVRTPQGLTFPHCRGRFSCSIHEWNTARELGLFEHERTIETADCDERFNFSDFVDHYYESRMAAVARGDLKGKLFYKLILNSSYGKFAQNPEKYEEYQIRSVDEVPLPVPWFPKWDNTGYIIWGRPTEADSKCYHNVLTGASITGAARAVLMRAIHRAEKPFYCDTDSIICRNLPEGDGVKIDKTELGAWKLEAEGDTIAIAGKKLYAVFKDSECIKLASKGARVTPEEIRFIAGGGEVEYRHESPAMKLGGQQVYVKRRIRRT